jgi:hypothetical protein
VWAASPSGVKAKSKSGDRRSANVETPDEYRTRSIVKNVLNALSDPLAQEVCDAAQASLEADPERYLAEYSNRFGNVPTTRPPPSNGITKTVHDTGRRSIRRHLDL